MQPLGLIGFLWSLPGRSRTQRDSSAVLFLRFPTVSRAQVVPRPSDRRVMGKLARAELKLWIFLGLGLCSALSGDTSSRWGPYKEPESQSTSVRSDVDALWHSPCRASFRHMCLIIKRLQNSTTLASCPARLPSIIHRFLVPQVLSPGWMSMDCVSGSARPWTLRPLSSACSRLRADEPVSRSGSWLLGATLRWLMPWSTVFRRG